VVDIFDEIREEAKEERWLDLWKKYQNYVYGFMALCIALTAFDAFWKRHQTSKNLEASEKYISALHSIGSKNVKTALGLLEEIPLNNKGSYKDLSRFLVAALLQEEGDDEGALEVYRSIVNDTAGDETYRNLALLRLAYAGFDTEDPKDLLKSLHKLTKDSSPWRFSALELTALLHMKLGNVEEAKASLTKLLDGAKDYKEAPQFVVFRAESLLRSLQNEKTGEKSGDKPGAAK
jgi:hypothetical protein